MSYVIARVIKVKSTAIGAMQYHNDRAPGEHLNPDIDPERTHLNYELHDAEGCYLPRKYAAEVDAKIAANRTSGRKVRKDAVKLVEGIITASPEFFEGKSEEECRRFFEDAYAFVCAEMGAENVIHFTVHMDETTPHAHWGAVPIKDGRLSWKAFFDGRGGLSAFQDRCFEKVGKPWGLDRGEKHSGRRYRETAEMKRDLEQEVEELREQKAALIDERKNKMTDQRYREILPMAYMTAAIEKGRQPRPVEVGLCARAIVDAEDENNLAYRVAMATKIHCTIVGVKRVSTKTGYDKYEITYRTFGKDEDETIPSPLIGDFRYGKVTEWLWAKKNDDGTDYWPGRRAVLYKHNDPPKEGDMSSAGYRCCVFAEALDK